MDAKFFSISLGYIGLYVGNDIFVAGYLDRVFFLGNHSARGESIFTFNAQFIESYCNG